MEGSRSETQGNIQVDFNPSERKDRRKRVLKALKVLESTEYLTEEEWDKLSRLREKSRRRDFVRWMKNRGLK